MAQHDRATAPVRTHVIQSIAELPVRRVGAKPCPTSSALLRHQHRGGEGSPPFRRLQSPEVRAGQRLEPTGPRDVPCVIYVANNERPIRKDHWNFGVVDEIVLRSDKRRPTKGLAAVAGGPYIHP